MLTLAPSTLAATQGKSPFDDLVPELSPFTGVRMEGDTYEVRVDDTWYRLVSINGHGADTFLEYCRERYGDRAEKRFAEDLVAVMIGMGHTVTKEADLVLADLKTGKEIERTEAMTKENRSAVWSERNKDRNMGVLPGQWAAAQRVEREHSAEVDPRYADLATGVNWDGWKRMTQIRRKDAERDLDQLEYAVREQHSYAHMRGVDIAAAFDALRVGLPDSLPEGAFAERLTRLIALFGDGHARVRGLDLYLPSGYLPFLIADAQEGVVAFQADRRSFVDPERPFLKSIDGQPLEAWLAAIDDLESAGSARHIRYRSLRRLRHLAYARLRMGAEASPTVAVELCDAKGENGQTHVLELSMLKPTYGTWPRTENHVRDTTAYVRIDRMDDDARFKRKLLAAMEGLDGMEKLVIDVRGNGGGTRDALRIVLPHVLTRSGGPHVYNVAAYRLPKDETENEELGHLQNRGLFPAASKRFTEKEAYAIGLAAMPFVADWTPPSEDFTEWHYGVVSPTDASPEEPREVIVLQDTGCFSATDIFLGALSGLPGVTLMGTPSGGGSGRSQGLTLSESRLEVRLSSMASFRPDGRRYDGVGIEVDVEVLPEAGDFLIGGGDAVLRAALAR